jgi:hypothetical protein
VIQLLGVYLAVRIVIVKTEDESQLVLVLPEDEGNDGPQKIRFRNVTIPVVVQDGKKASGDVRVPDTKEPAQLGRRHAAPSVRMIAKSFTHQVEKVLVYL